MQSEPTVPAHVSPSCVREFDYIGDPLEYPRPFAAYRQFDGVPYVYSPTYGGHWILSDPELVRDAFRRADLFSSYPARLVEKNWGRRMIPIESDPPEHSFYRRVLGRFFTPAASVGAEPVALEVVRPLIDRFADRGSCELVAEFARPYPSAVFLSYVLHLPTSELEMVSGWAHGMLHATSPEQAQECSNAISDYLDAVLTERSRRPLEDDLLSGLLAADVDGQPLSRQQMIDLATNVFIAGLDTVTGLIAFSFWHLAEHPEQVRYLVEHPEAIPTAVEELLRVHPLVSVARTVTRDENFHGLALRAGDRVWLPIPRINFDVSTFDDPDQVDLLREQNRHLTFGGGPHRCLGSHLARRELAIALREFHRVIPAYTRDPEREVAFTAAGLASVNELHLTWPRANEAGR